MKLFKIIIILAMIFAVSTAAEADDFNWTRDFNIQAKADPSGFKARFAERFDLSDVQVIALLNIFDTPADAYIMLRFGEMQGRLKKISKEQGIEAVKKYRHNRDKGWNEMADILGVNSGSKEFHALKRGHDLDGGKDSPALYNTAYASSRSINADNGRN